MVSTTLGIEWCSEGTRHNREQVDVKDSIAELSKQFILLNLWSLICDDLKSLSERSACGGSLRSLLCTWLCALQSYFQVVILIWRQIMPLFSSVSLFPTAIHVTYLLVSWKVEIFDIDMIIFSFLWILKRCQAVSASSFKVLKSEFLYYPENKNKHGRPEYEY